jgi:hypothetical protein
MAMGNRTARNTGILGTSVEAIGDEEKMSDLNESPLVKLDRIQREAEARGYRRGRTFGIIDAANHAEKTISEIIVGIPMGLTLSREIKQAILALLEQTSDTNSPHPKSGAGSSAKTK